MPGLITLKDLARMSKVSVSTVSKALNERTDVNEITKRRIQDLAKKYNYVPNNSAISLRKQRTNTIAIIVPIISNILYGEILSEIEKISFDQGYKIMVLQSFASSEKEFRCFQSIEGRSVDGVIIISESEIKNELKFNRTIPKVSMIINPIENKNGKHKRLATFFFDTLISKIN